MATINLDAGCSLLTGAPPVHMQGPCTFEADLDALPAWDSVRKYLRLGKAQIVEPDAPAPKAPRRGRSKRKAAPVAVEAVAPVEPETNPTESE